MFGCIDTGVRNRNIMSVTFEDNEPAYIAGAAAAKLLAPGTKIGWRGTDPSFSAENV